MKSAAARDPLPADPLLAPLRLGRREAPSRIVFGAHLTNFPSGNSFGERHLAFYAARAAGGAGVIVTEALTVHPLDWPYEHVPFGHTDAIVPALARLGEALRRAALDSATPGAPPLVLAQLNHTGGQCAGRNDVGKPDNGGAEGGCAGLDETAAVEAVDAVGHGSPG